MEWTSMVHIWGQPLEDSRWYFSEKWSTYQRTGGRVAVYLERQLFGAYAIKMYLRGQINICMLEARVTRHGNVKDLIELADYWLNLYSEGIAEQIEQDYYYVFSACGAWTNPEAKCYYLCHEAWNVN
jgi:hypothetical protein